MARRINWTSFFSARHFLLRRHYIQVENHTGVAASMCFNLTVGGIETLFSLPGDVDRVPITVQVRDVYSQPTKDEVVISDGVHFCTVTLAKRLHHLIASLELKTGVFLILQNYITQPIDNSNVMPPSCHHRLIPRIVCCVWRLHLISVL